MFRIVCGPSSGSTELYLTETTRGGSQIFFVRFVGVWQRNFWTRGVCVCTVRRYGLQPTTGSKITLPNTDQAHEKYLWATTSSFSQVQLYTSWRWTTYDPKHVGVISVSFNLLYNVDFIL
jgi:hypothetical protein